MIGAAKRKSISPPGLTALRTILLLVVTLFLHETRVWGFEITPQPASGVFAPANPLSIGENYDGWQYDASDSLLAAKTTVKPSLTAHKEALAKVHEKVGELPKGQPGKFGAPQAGTPKKGYRLDPPHPKAKPGSPETGYHFNYWDYTKGKRGSGGVSDAIPIE